jgi:hypothetical protein
MERGKTAANLIPDDLSSHRELSASRDRPLLQPHTRIEGTSRSEFGIDLHQGSR